MLIESVPGEPLSFHVIPFDNPRFQSTLQVCIGGVLFNNNKYSLIIKCPTQTHFLALTLNCFLFITKSGT